VQRAIVDATGVTTDRRCTVRLRHQLVLPAQRIWGLAIGITPCWKSSLPEHRPPGCIEYRERCPALGKGSQGDPLYGRDNSRDCPNPDFIRPPYASVHLSSRRRCSPLYSAVSNAICTCLWPLAGRVGCWVRKLVLSPA